jgi:hypothetical protein
LEISQHFLDRSQRYSKNYNNSNIGENMSNVKNIVMEVEEFVWDFFDADGTFVADEIIKSKDDLMEVVENNFGYMGVEVAKEEILAIETADHFTQTL